MRQKNGGWRKEREEGAGTGGQAWGKRDLGEEGHFPGVLFVQRYVQHQRSAQRILLQGHMMLTCP